MKTDSKKCKISEENDGRDRLSELPDQLLVHILSFLPTLDAVRTVLLRRFGNLWTMIPSLDFADDEILYAKELLSDNVDKDEIGRSDMNNCFTSYVRNVLLFHNRATIRNFRLEIFELDWLGNNSRRNRAVLDEIKMWIKYAIHKEVQVLNLHCCIDGSVLPRCVFTSQFLVKLRISGVEIEIKHLSQVHMGALKSLSLSHVELSNELFKKLISGCPSLQVLDVKDPIGLDELHLIAPTIEELYIDFNPCLLDCPKLKLLDITLRYSKSLPKVVDVSSLHKVNVCLICSSGQINNELVKMFCKAEVFKLSHIVDRPFQLKEPDLPQTRWSHLRISSHLHNKEELLSICRLLRISPHLEELELYTDPCPGVSKDCCKLSLEVPLPCVMSQLKIVTLRGYTVSCQGLLRVVEFFLKSAAALEKIVIVSKKCELATVDEVEFVKKLSGFSKASTTAKVVFR